LGRALVSIQFPPTAAALFAIGPAALTSVQWTGLGAAVLHPESLWRQLVAG